MSIKKFFVIVIVAIGIYLFFDLFFIPLIDSAFSYSNGITERVEEAEKEIGKE